jgi:hypothetical protein
VSLLKIDFLNVKTFCANADFCECRPGHEPLPYLLTPSEHRVQAADLRKANPRSRAAELHELAARLKERAKGGSVVWLPIAPSIVPLRDDLGCR